MNETLKSIAVQAQVEHCISHVRLEEFAKLIVEDCINKITTYDLVPGHSAKWEDIYDIHARLLKDLGEELKDHFGVHNE